MSCAQAAEMTTIMIKAVSAVCQNALVMGLLLDQFGSGSHLNLFQPHS
jgi:hypothetical protein